MQAVKIYISFLLLVLSVSLATAQSSDEFSKNKKSKQRISHTMLLDSAKVYLSKDADRSIQFVEESLRELNMKKNRDENAVATSYALLGDVYFHWEAYDLAIKNYTIALKSISSEKKNTVKLQLARSYHFTKNYEESNRIILDIKEEMVFFPMTAVKLWEILGDNWVALKALTTGLEAYREGLEIAEEHKFLDNIISLNSKIADVHEVQGNFQEAELGFQNSVSIAQQQSVQQEVVQNEKLADFYRGNNQLNKEISVRKNSLDQLNQLPEDNFNISNQQSLNYDIADAYVAQERYVEAIPYLNKSIEVSSVSEDLEIKKIAVQRLSEVYKKVGDYDNALKSYQQYVELVDLIYAKKETEIENASKFSNTLASNQNRINILEKDRELTENQYVLIEKDRELVIESNRRQRLIIYGLLAGLVLLMAILFFLHRSNQQKKLANNLLALKSLRVQMNPHFIFNALNSVNNFIAKNDERTANKYLTDFSNLMRAVLENSEKDFILLSEEISLIQLYLKLEHARFTEKFDYIFEVDKNVSIEQFTIPPMLLQPYIENAVWHGLRYKKDKGNLTVNIQQKDKNTLSITITDDGIGRQKSAALKTQNQLKKTSKGMGNISSRIAILNEMYDGKVSVDITNLLESGEGTVVRLEVKN